MTSRYNVTVESPLGLREGTLTLTISQGEVTGTLSLLGFCQPVQGIETGQGRLILTHSLRTAVSNLACKSALTISQETLSGTMGTPQWSVPVRGVLEHTEG